MSQCAPVSVVIPSYNCGQWIGQAIESVLAQSLRPAEIIVIDDGSTDDTNQKLSCFADKIIYRPQCNRGVAAARNAGVASATTPWIAFLDADDVWHPRKLELQLAALSRRRDLLLLGTRLFHWPTETWPEEAYAAGSLVDVDWRRLVVKNVIANSTVIAAKHALQQAGLFDTNLQGPEDWDLWLRVAEIGRVANLDLPLVGYRSVPGSVSRQADTCRRGMLRVLDKIDQRNPAQWNLVIKRRAYASMNHECSHVYGLAGRYARAISAELESIAWWPLPMRKAELGASLGRLRRLTVQGLRWMHLKAGDKTSQPTFPSGHLDALERHTSPKPTHRPEYTVVS